MKVLIEIFLDGYESAAELKQATLEFIYDQLDFSGSSVHILKTFTDDEEVDCIPVKKNVHPDQEMKNMAFKVLEKAKELDLADEEVSPIDVANATNAFST